MHTVKPCDLEHHVWLCPFHVSQQLYKHDEKDEEMLHVALNRTGTAPTVRGHRLSFHVLFSFCLQCALCLQWRLCLVTNTQLLLILRQSGTFWYLILSGSFLALWDGIIRIILICLPFYWSLLSRISWTKKRPRYRSAVCMDNLHSSTSWRGESPYGSQKSVCCLTKHLFFVNFRTKGITQPWSITSTLNMGVSSKVTLALATRMRRSGTVSLSWG